MHRVNGDTLDKDSVAVITASNEREAREVAFKLFGEVWATSQSEKDFDKAGNIKWFPRGKIEVN